MEWQVTGQAFSTVYDQLGNPQDQWTVTFQLSDGTVGRVIVPAANYTAVEVAKAIHPVADQMIAVAQLSSTHLPHGV